MMDENTDKNPTVGDERFAAGMRMLNRVDGDAGACILDSLRDACPELGYHIVVWGFGDIYSREGLHPRDRQLTTLGMFTALGGCEPQLEMHVGVALNVGLSPEEIVEVILHASTYCGFLRSLNAMFATKRVFSERGLLSLAD